MECMTFIKRENVRKAEEKLKSDFNLAAKQSIAIRDAKSLDIDKDGSFFLIIGTEEGLTRCKELIKEFAEDIDTKIFDKAKEKLKEEADKAAEGFGGVF